MRANTDEIDVRTANSSNISVEKRAYRCDPFEVRDGRYVGHDWFVVPKDFNEFYQRFPNYVHQWVSKHVSRSASSEDVEDWAQDLLMHLSHLLEKSKFRAAGKEDIIQTFDPSKQYGANQARFRNYVNLCLSNKFRTMHSKRIKDALCRPNNFSIDDGLLESDSSVTESYCQSNSPQLRAMASANRKQTADRVFMQHFVQFVHRHDPTTLPLIDALGATRTQAEAAQFMGVTDVEFGRMRYRLDRLRKCFLTGEPVARQRRPYKKRMRRMSSEDLPMTA